jgi:hypothetical protein
MKNFKSYLALISACYIFVGIYFLNQTPTIHYPVQEITSFEQPVDQLNRCGEHTLVLLDVDDVLIISPDYIARGHLPWWLRIRLLWAFPELLKESVAELAYSLGWQQAPRVLIEPQVVRIINDLKQQGCIVLGLTSMESGSYGVIPSMSLWRANMLKDMGIVFSQQYPNQVYTKLPAYRDNYPVLFEGILCCNQQPKGAVLAAFFDANNMRPENIIFFDDSMSNLQSVGKTCAERNIPCTLFQYLGGERFSNTLDTAYIIKQIGILINEHKWTSDQEIVTAF